MIEYLYNAIRASAGTDLTIAAQVLDSAGNPITEGCELVLHLNDESMLTVDGEFSNDIWVFIIPAKYTVNLKGRSWYCVKHNDEQLCFKQPIYFV